MSSFSRSDQGAWMKQLKDVFNAPEVEQAKGRARELAERLRRQRKMKQAEWLEESIEDCLTVYAFPEEHRKKLRTTNVAERLNGEIRRRVNIIRVFPDPGSLMRVVTAECTNATEKWMEKRYMEIRNTGEVQQAI